MDIITKRIYEIIKQKYQPLTLKQIYLEYKNRYGLDDFEGDKADYTVIIRRHIYTYCIDRDLQTKEPLFFPLNPKQQKGQKYGVIEWYKPSDLSIYNQPRIKTKEEWLKIIENEIEYNKKTNKGFIPVLKYLYFSKDYSSKAILLAKNFHTNVGTINLCIKNFGQRLCKLMNLEEISYGRKQRTYWNIPFKGMYDEQNHFTYILRDELVSALADIDFDQEEVKVKDVIKEITLVNWNYENSIPLGEPKISRKKADYVKANENKAKVGLAGELSIIKFEKKRLLDAGYKEYSEKVKQVSLNNDSLGYDILSYDIIDGIIKEIHIEVKTTVSKTPILEFYITDNEWKKYKNDLNHRIYYLYDIECNPKLHIVDRNSFKEEFLQPVLYKVKVRVNDDK